MNLAGFATPLNVWTNPFTKTRPYYTPQKKTVKTLGKKFVEYLEDDLKEVYRILKTVKPIKMSEEEELSFKQAEICYACKEKLVYTEELGCKNIN